MLELPRPLLNVVLGFLDHRSVHQLELAGADARGRVHASGTHIQQCRGRLGNDRLRSRHGVQATGGRTLLSASCWTAAIRFSSANPRAKQLRMEQWKWKATTSPSVGADGSASRVWPPARRNVASRACW